MASTIALSKLQTPYLPVLRSLQLPLPFRHRATKGLPSIVANTLVLGVASIRYEL